MASKAVTHSDHATSTVSLRRLGVFLPVDKCSKKTTKYEVETPYGKAIIRGKLTQIHCDIIEWVLTYHINKYVYPDTGNIAFLFNAYQLMRDMGHKDPDTRWFFEKVEELRQASITIDGREWRMTSGIVSRHKHTAPRTDYRKESPTGKIGNGKPYVIEFSAEFLRVFDLDMNVNHPKLVKEIVCINKALIRACVRFLLSMKCYGKTVDDMLLAVGAINNKTKSRTLRDKHKTILDSVDVFEKFGICISGSKIQYSQHPLVWFKEEKNLHNQQAA